MLSGAGTSDVKPLRSRSTPTLFWPDGTRQGVVPQDFDPFAEGAGAPIALIQSTHRALCGEGPRRNHLPSDFRWGY